MQTLRAFCISVIWSGLALLVVASGGMNPAWGQDGEDRHHFLFKVGAAYDQGDFETSETTRVLYMPLTLRYLGNRFDVSVTPYLASVDAPNGVRIIDGVPTYTGAGTGAELGVGDTIVRSRFYLHQESRSGSGFPSITPFLKVKVPTARDELALGTGEPDYGFGVQWDKQLSPLVLFGDAGYTVVGKVQGLNLRNRPEGSFGVGGRVSDRMTLSGLVDWRRSKVTGNGNLSELVGVFNYRLSPEISVSPNVFVGLTGSTSDFGTGVEFAFRFGRY